MKNNSRVISIGIIAILFLSLLCYFKFSDSSKSVDIINLNEEVKSYITQIETTDIDKNKAYYNCIRVRYDELVNQYVREENRGLARYALLKEQFEPNAVLRMNTESFEALNVEEMIYSSYKKCNKYIKNEHIKVLLFPTSGETTAFTASDNFMIIYVNGLGKREDLEKQIEWIFAHEYVHASTEKKAIEENQKSVLYPKCVLDDMVFEGKAVVFADFVIGDYGYKPDKKYVPREWAYYKDVLTDPRYKIVAYQYCKIGNDSFPRIDVYLYGTELVKLFLKETKENEPKYWIYIHSNQFEKFKHLLL